MVLIDLQLDKNGRIIENIGGMIQFKLIVLMASSREEEEVLFEEEEVLWAKIRGYPWWPAFVDKLHPPVRGKQTEYTVFFFGDNTQYPSSKLGASKLRKFYENYTEFYQKARAHRRLMASIELAEEKLRQNDQNVEIFEELRNSLKKDKKEKPKTPLNRKQSKISEPDHSISEIKEMPDLNKSKTYTHPRGRRSHAVKEEEEAHCEVQQQKPKAQPIKQELPSSRQTQKSNKKQLKKEEVAPSPPKRKRNAKQQIFQEQQQPKSIKKAVEVREQRPTSPQKEKKVQKIVEEEAKESPQGSQEIEADSQQIQDEEDNHSEQSQDVVYEKKLRNTVKRNQIDLQRAPSGQRKRGRPKKRLLRHHSQDDRTQVLSRSQSSRIPHLKRKIIHKTRPSPKKVEIVTSSLSQSDIHIVDHIRKILHKREELVEYLSSVSITIHNVQEILDLGVSNILQDGERTPKITDLLFVLRNVLLYKYFPDDVKHRKKYEQILKKKPIVIKSDEKEKEQSSQEKEDQSIRKKTIVKLQKFLKLHPDIQSKARQLAIRIESYFQKADKDVGETYKSMAYKVLSSLKEKKESYNEVMKKLDQHAYD